MARYIVERSFPEGFRLPKDGTGDDVVAKVVGNNILEGVNWVHSYFAVDRKKSYCIYDGPSPEAVRKVAAVNGLPVDRITQVRVLDPYYFYAG